MEWSLQEACMAEMRKSYKMPIGNSYTKGRKVYFSDLYIDETIILKRILVVINYEDSNWI